MTLPAFRASCLTALFAVGAALSAHADSTVNVYLSAPFTETAGSSGLPTSDGTAAGTPTTPTNTPNTLGFAGTATEPFNQTTGTYTTLTSTALSNATFVTSSATGFAIDANGKYGGGGQGNYLGVPAASSPVTITFNSPVGYFGLLWCAVDAGNSLTIYDQNNVLIGTFKASTFAALLPTTGTIEALNGNTYNTADYYGQPTGTTTTTNRQDAPEQFAYLNFVAGSGTTISKIVESETGATFESDNYSILTTAPTVNSTSNGNVVFVSTVPEPATWTLAIVAGGLTWFGARRRRHA